MSEELNQERSETARPTGPTINLTPKAIEMVRSMHQKDGLAPDVGLRIAVVGGGCSGFQYSLNFDSRKDGDIVTILDGVSVLVDELSLPYIEGTTLDFVEGLHNAGFRFDNPRASHTCGCGSSFTA